MAHPANPAHGPVSHAEHHGSFMPLYLTIGTTLFLLGTLNVWLALPGFLIMVASVAGWVREDVHELRGKPFQQGHSDYWAGTIVLILSEVVIFGILFTFYFWSRAHQGEAFLPEAILGMDLAPIILNTVILLSSGATVHTAQVYLKRGQIRKFQIWLAATILLGAAFLVGQVVEYSHLMHEGLTPQSGVYGTAFYSLTGVHGLHVLAGLVALIIILGLSFTGFIRQERASGVEGAFLYWHFVDGIWIVVFTVVYLRWV